MSFVYYNPNPKKKNTGDCVVRALAKFFDTDWLTAYMNICSFSALYFDMPQAVNNLTGGGCKVFPRFPSKRRNADVHAR